LFGIILLKRLVFVMTRAHSFTRVAELRAELRNLLNATKSTCAGFTEFDEMTGD